MTRLFGVIGHPVHHSLSPELVDYSLHSVTKGKDALGEVTVKLRHKGLDVIGRGTSTDVIEASAKAYLNAINKLISSSSRRSYVKRRTAPHP